MLFDLEVVVAKRRWRYLPEHLRNEVICLAAQGLSNRKIESVTGVGLRSVCRVLRPLGGVALAAQEWSAVPGHLDLEERVEIYLGLDRGWSYAQIGRELGRPRQTIWREVTDQGRQPRARYQPVAAHRAARLRSQRPKDTKLAAD